VATRILNIPVRAFLREQDSLTGSYPTIARTGDADRSGKAAIAFNDRDTIIFETRQINLPYGLGIGTLQLSRQNTVNDLTASGHVLPGIGDAFAKMTTVESEDLSPFVDFGRPEYRTGEFFMTGTDRTVLPGFSSPLKSKTIIKIDLSASSDSIITRSPSLRNDYYDPGGDFAGVDKAGFAYFNFVTRNWEDQGLFDPATGTSYAGTALQHYDWAIDPSAAPPNYAVTSGTNRWCQQFTAPDMLEGDTDQARLNNTNLLHVGYPTVSMQAPFANRYHAIASQALKMENFISHPFLLEKAVLSFSSVEARRLQQWDGDLGDTASRYMDDYVFFLYRQENTNNTQDSAADVSGSQRYLICSASMCFYNELIKKTGSLDPQSDEFAPIHSPDFSHNFGMLDTGPNLHKLSWDGPVDLKMTCAVASPFIPGYFFVTGSNDVGDQLEANALVFNFWPGGTTSKSFLPSKFTGREPEVDTNFGDTLYSHLVPASLNKTAAEMDLIKLDHRAHAMLGRGGRETQVGLVGGRAVSPYLLLPTDSLVLGVDSLLGLVQNQLAHTVTGSYLKIFGGLATLTLYGSLIRDNVEFHDTLNQPLTSEAIHEDLHFDNPTVDQFNIEREEVYSGSYINRIMTGNIFSDDIEQQRRVVSAGSFSRSGRHETSNEIFYDSIPPSLSEYVIRAGATAITSVSATATAIPDKCYTFGDWNVGGGQPTLAFRESRASGAVSVMPNPYVGNPQRVINDLTKLYTYRSIGPDDQYVGGELLRQLLFIRGSRREAQGVTTNRFYHSPVTGAMGYRYGLMAVEPTKSSAQFRYDHFGQFRDVLEQRHFSVFFNDLSDRVRIRGASQKLGTKTGPVTIRFVSGSVTISPGDAEYSLNISTVATSSRPYIDDF